jgi:hypothetical protein
MKTAIGVVVAVALAFAAVPAAGAGGTFHAFSPLPAVEQGRLTPLPDAHLATVEGAALVDIAVNLNLAVQNQLNLCVLSGSCRQTNIGVIPQRIRTR